MAGKGSPKGVRQGGREKGTPNKATRELRLAAQKYSKRCLLILYDIALKGDNDANRIAAVRELFDRGYGKVGLTMAPEDFEGGDGTITTIERTIIRAG